MNDFCPSPVSKGSYLGRAALTLALACDLGCWAQAQDWNQWRGPARDGVVANASAAWPDSWRTKWRVEAGEGYSSPVVADGRVFIHARRDPKEIVLAIDPATGASKWEWHGPGPGYASPIVIEVAGQRQLVTLTERSFVGVDIKTGSELWSVPFPDEWQENIVTPLWTGSHLVVSGVRQGTHAYTLQQTDGKWAATEVWHNASVAMYMSSPVSGDGLIYGHSAKQRGQFVALDTKTGAIHWASEGRDGDHAVVLLTPRHVVYLTNNGNLIAARRGTAKFEVERRYKVADTPTWTVPVFLGTDLLVRDATGLLRLTPGSQTAEPCKP